MNTQDFVNAGVALLNEKMPGWYCKLDLEELDISSSDKCVLGQLFESPAPEDRRFYTSWYQGGFNVGISKGRKFIHSPS